MKSEHRIADRDRKHIVDLGNHYTSEHDNTEKQLVGYGSLSPVP